MPNRLTIKTMYSGVSTAAIVASTCLVLTGNAHAGTCTAQWLPGGGISGVGPNLQSGSPLPVNAKASIMWDRDGAGGEDPVLVVGGAFSVAGNVAVNNVAIWNGTSWEALGLGVGTTGGSDAVNAFAIMPNGDLVAAGAFTTAGGAAANRIARWNGAAWSALGNGFNTTVNALALTTGGQLVAGGTFTSSPGSPSVTVNRIAKWNESISAWEPFIPTNGTMDNGLGNPGVNALIALPNGDLLVGGGFLNAGGGTGIHRIAIWETATSTWAPIAPGVTGTNGNGINTLLRLPNGHIYAGGNFTSINSVSANNIAHWDGTQWLALDQGLASPVRALAKLPDGNIVAGGDFSASGSTQLNRLGQWNGTTWSPLWNDTTNRNVYTLCLNNDNDLVVGGNFLTASGKAVSGVAVLDGSEWKALAGNNTTSGLISALTLLPNGDILAGGSFTQIEGVNANRVSLFTNGQWTALGTGVDSSFTPSLNVKAVLKLQNGDIVAAGEFQTVNNGATTAVGLTRWTSGQWMPFSTPGIAAGGQIQALLELPNGDLIIGGAFESIDGVPARRVARWNGTQWSAMGDGIDNDVQSLALLPTGEIAAGGNFSSVNNGTTAAPGLAFWDGETWYRPTPSLNSNSNVRAMIVTPGGDLIVGGSFISVDTNPVNRLAKWNGTEWSTLGSGVGTSNSNSVNALALLPNGDLIAAGEFTAATGVSPAPVRIARWNGTAWSAMGSGLNATAYSLVVDANGTLLVGGDFTKAGGVVSPYLARWGCPTPTGACCTGATCAISTEAACTGSYKGDASVCVNVNCCAADFNAVNGVTVQDIFDFLTAWLAGSPTANFNNINGVTVQDIFDFLTAWLAGC